MDAFTPQQTVELVARIGSKKADTRIDKLFINAFMAGPLLGFGCAALVSTNAAPWFDDNAPGLIRTIGAWAFPIGLVMVTMTGADLYPTNVMFMTTAFLSRRVSGKDVVITWFISLLGNAFGMVFFMTIIVGFGGVFTEEPAYQQAAIRVAVHKSLLPLWHQIFLRAIGANWLVCLAVWLSIQARESSSKIIAIWIASATFETLAMNHAIADMFFIPNGIWAGAPFGVGYYIWKSFVPALLGNTVGGSIFVGTAYWYLYLTGEGAVQISFDLDSLHTAVKGGTGPLDVPQISPNGSPQASQSTGSSQLVSINSRNSGFATPGFPRGQAMSGFGFDFSDESLYAKTCKQRKCLKEVVKDSLPEGTV